MKCYHTLIYSVIVYKIKIISYFFNLLRGDLSALMRGHEYFFYLFMYFYVIITTVLFMSCLGPNWFKGSGCGCGCRSLRMRVVAGLSGFKRFERLVLRLEISAFAGYLWLVNHQIQYRLNNKLTIFTFYIIINIKHHNIIINIKIKFIKLYF